MLGFTESSDYALIWFFFQPSRTSEYVVWDSGNYFALTIPAASKHHLGDYELRLTAGQGKEPMLTSCHVRGKSDFGAVPFDAPNR